MSFKIFLQEVLNKTLNFILTTTSLTKGQKTLLGGIPTELGVQCMLNMWSNHSYDEISQGTYCGAVWDDVYCWPPTVAGTGINRLCSETFHQINPNFASNMEGLSKRECLIDGTWAEGSKSDFTECRSSYEAFRKKEDGETYFIPIVQNTLLYGSIVSLLCLGVSLAIFICFRCLQCDRVTVNLNLIVSLILRYIMLLIIAEPFVLSRISKYEDVGILCESIQVVFLYTTVASIAWMFVQGLFINISLSTRIFPAGNTSSHIKVYYIIGWVVPAGLIMAYVIAMVLKEKQEKCWRGYLEMNEMWILLAPLLFALVGNGLLFINILRIFLKNIRKSKKNKSQLSATFKAIAILFPVLGLNNLMVFYNPGGDYNKYFVIINTFLGSTQGIFVAIVHCFTNNEVIAAICRAIDRAKARRECNSIRAEANGTFYHQKFSKTGRMIQMITRHHNDPSGNKCSEQAV